MALSLRAVPYVPLGCPGLCIVPPDRQAPAEGRRDGHPSRAHVHLSGTPTAAEEIVRGRYVLPGGVLSRDPLGNPPSIACSVNKTFTATGPATAVQLAGGTVINPAAWVSLSGRSEATPDRNTRGYLDANGQRHWLDVFADPAPAVTAPEAPWAALLLLLVGAGISVAAVRRRRRRSAVS